MPKTIFSITTTADNIQSHLDQSTARFIVEDKPVPGKDGQPARTAKTIVQIVFANDKGETATQFKSNKSYKITIEEQ